MELTRRFVFNGHASAIGGRIVRMGQGRGAKRLDEAFIDTPGAALSSSGGRSSATIPGGTVEHVQFGQGSVRAEGVFDHVEAHYRLTLGKAHEERLTATTRVNATLNALVIGIKPQVAIERLVSSLISTSPTGSFETPVRIGKDTTISDVTIVENGKKYRLRIALDPTPFNEQDTLSRLLAAADDPKFVRKHGPALFMNTTFAGKAEPPAFGRLIKSRHSNLWHGTIVKSIKWIGSPHPGTKIDGHSIIVRNIGQLFFGEVQIKWGHRRLTMLRGVLGSHMGGGISAADVRDNGIWSI